MIRNNINPLQWHSAIGVARQICARVFRDGGTPADAVTAFGLEQVEGLSWSKAVDVIAERLCLRNFRMAA
jgi:hypothetical protein